MVGFLNVFPFVYSYVADHFQYLACLGIIVPLAAGAWLAVARLPGVAKGFGRGALVAVVGALALLAWRQSKMYANASTLYQTTIDKNPNCWMAYINLGLEDAKNHDQEPAIECYQRALELHPKAANAHNDLAIAWQALGNYDRAIDEYSQA